MFSLLKNKNLAKGLITVYRNYSERSNNMKVAVIGAAGHVGQPLSMMLKQSPYIDELAMYDINNVNSIATELAFMDTKCKVTSAKGRDCAKFALKGAKVVVVIAAAPKSCVLSSNAMFDANAEMMKNLAELCAEYCPKAYFAIATNPVNSMIPLFSETLKKKGCYNPKAVFGVTTLNVVRANSFVAEVLGLEPECVIVPVVGGNSGRTIVPLLSHAKPIAEFTLNELETLTEGIQDAHANIIKARKNKCPALSCSFSIARFVIAMIKGLQGHPNIVECAFVKTLQFENTKYFASPIELGISGLQRNLGIPKVLTDYEQCLIDTAIPLITNDVKRGELYVGVKDPLEPCDICTPEPRSAKCPEDWCDKNAKRTLYD